MSVRTGICVLAGHDSTRVNALQNGAHGLERRCAGSVYCDRCRSIWELQKSMLPLAVNIGSHHGFFRIDIPDNSPSAVGHVISLEDPILNYVSVGVVWLGHHVHVKASHNAAIRGRASM